MTEPASHDVRRVAKTHFIIFARQFIEEFADYFDDCPAVQKAKAKFMAVFGDVPTGLDDVDHSELLYEFTELGDAAVTPMLNNFGKFIRPYKPHLEARDASVWQMLVDLPEAQDNLIKQLDIAGKWTECDAETQECIWIFVETLVYYGSMYTTYSHLPESMMNSLNECALSVIQDQTESGEPLTEANIQASLGELAPKIMASLKQEDIMKFGMKMLENPSVLQDLMGMARNVQGGLPGINAQDMMQKMMPAGMDFSQIQSMMSAMGGGSGGGGMDQMQAMMSTMAASLGGGAK